MKWPEFSFLALIHYISLIGGRHLFLSRPVVKNTSRKNDILKLANISENRIAKANFDQFDSTLP